MKLSPSKLVTYDKCPRKFYYRYVADIKEPATAAMVRGNIFHKILEDFYLVVDIHAYIDTPWDKIAENFEKITEQLFDAEWAKIGMDHEDVFAEEEKTTFYKETKEFLKFFAIKEAFRLHELLKQNKLGDRWFNENVSRGFYPKAREMRISTDEMHGFIDKTINVFGRGVGVVDYKTSKSPLPHFIDKSHLLQLKAYAYLFKEKTGKLPYHLSIYYARTGESVYYETSEIDVEEIKEMIKKIRTLKREIGNFRQSPTKLCNYCFYKDICKPNLSNI